MYSFMYVLISYAHLQRLDQKTAQLIHLQRVTMEHNVCMRGKKHAVDMTQT